MARKHDREAPQVEAPDPETEEGIEESTVEPEAPEASEHWEMGQWNGLPRYQCRYCAFDSLEVETIARHYQERHAPPLPPPPPPRPLIFDRFGNPLEGR